MIKKLRGFFATLGVLVVLIVPIIIILLRRRPAGNEITDDARKTLEQVREVVKEVAQSQEDRRARAEAAREKLKKIMTGALVLVLCFAVSLGPLGSLAMASPATATDGGMAGQEIYIPEDYDELVEYYLAAVEVAQEYQQLYEEAEAEVSRLLEQVETLDAEVERLAGYIDHYCRPAWGLTGGLELGESVQWKLGVARKKEWLSFGGGVGGGDEFSLWGSVTVWWQSPF